MLESNIHRQYYTMPKRMVAPLSPGTKQCCSYKKKKRNMAQLVLKLLLFYVTSSCVCVCIMFSSVQKLIALRNMMALDSPFPPLQINILCTGTVRSQIGIYMRV